jgi:microcystin degradation protein MlrC
MRVFTATLGTETNTFSPIPTALASFRDSMLYRAGEHPDRPTMFTAPLWAARERAKARGWQVIEGLCAFAEPAGPTVRADYEALRDELLADLHRALPVDMVLLGMHGAMVAEGYDDCEGDLLARVRALVGPKTAVGAELDPHCHLTRAMLDNADVIICFKEYPHTDFLERGAELADLCAEMAAGKIRPAMSVFDCRMIGIYHTPREPMRGFVDRMSALEGKDGVLSISVVQTFPWGDVADLGTKILVVTDNRPDIGAALAERLGRELYALRGKTSADYLTIDAALDRALAIEGGPVVIADSPDNPGGGAPGDATFVLAALLARGIGNVALGPFWDPQAVRFCHDAGLGARLRLRIGGKTGPMSGAPLDVAAEVRHLARDATQRFGGTASTMGDVAAIRADGIDIVLNGVRTQAFGTDLFTGNGVTLADKKLIVVKSSQHFHAAFAPLAKAVLYVGGPGAIATDFSTLPYRKARRPIWPLDPDPLGGSSL